MRTYRPWLLEAHWTVLPSSVGLVVFMEAAPYSFIGACVGVTNRYFRVLINRKFGSAPNREYLKGRKYASFEKAYSILL